MNLEELELETLTSLLDNNTALLDSFEFLDRWNIRILFDRIDIFGETIMLNEKQTKLHERLIKDVIKEKQKEQKRLLREIKKRK